MFDTQNCKKVIASLPNSALSTADEEHMFYNTAVIVYHTNLNSNGFT